MRLKFDFNKIIGYFNLNSERGLSVNPSRDWKAVFIGSLLFLIAVFAIDIYSLMSVKKQTELITFGTKGNKELSINNEALDGVLKDIDARAEIFRKNYSSPSVFIPASTTAPVI